jgi:hypothetical protein
MTCHMFRKIAPHSNTLSQPSHFAAKTSWHNKRAIQVDLNASTIELRPIQHYYYYYYYSRSECAASPDPLLLRSSLAEPLLHSPTTTPPTKNPTTTIASTSPRTFCISKTFRLPRAYFISPSLCHQPKSTASASVFHFSKDRLDQTRVQESHRSAKASFTSQTFYCIKIG